MLEQHLAVIQSTSRTRVGLATTQETVKLSSGTYTRCVAKGGEFRAQVIAQQSGYPVETYVLARMVASEEGQKAAAYKLAVAEAARNEARRRGATLLKLLTDAKGTETDGWFGEQHGRWASTRWDPTRQDIAAAEVALRERTELAAGASRFFSPKVQAGGVQNGRSIDPPEQVIVRWGNEGWQWVGPVEGMDPWELMLFRKGSGGADTRAAVALVEHRRDGGGEPGGGGVFVAAALAAKALL